MKTISNSLMVALLAAGIFYACKKKTSDLEPDPVSIATTTGSAPVNLVCDGKGTNVY